MSGWVYMDSRDHTNIGANRLLERLLAGDSDSAWRLYQGLENPTPLEDRFAGTALLNLGEAGRAKNLLLRAWARGCPEAGIELSTVARSLGDFRLAHKALQGLDLTALSDFDKCLFFREKGMLLYETGRLEDAIEHLEEAWGNTFRTPLAEALKPPILHALGFLYSLKGFEHQATECFDSALSNASPARRLMVLSSRALSLIYLGRYDQAAADLAAIEAAASRPPVVELGYLYDRALLAKALGDRASAKELFCRCAERAEHYSQRDFESYADLSLVSLYTADGDTAQARKYLAKARGRVSSERAALMLSLREGVLAGAEGAAKLAEVAEQFERGHFYREASWAWAHLANAYLKQQNPAMAELVLNKAIDACHALRSVAALSPELRLMPELLEYMASLAPDRYAAGFYQEYLKLSAAKPGLRQLRLVSLGASRLLLDGQPVRLGLSRSLEVLAYLLRKPGNSLEGILADLFPDADPKQARNYFHQTRYDLEGAVPGLSIPFDRLRRSYSVQFEDLDFSWDADDVLSALNTPEPQTVLELFELYRGPFLPAASSEWAEMEREELAWSALKIGLQILERWFEQGMYRECLALGRRLLEIDPCSEPLCYYIIESVRSLEGEIAARLEYERICERYRRELGEVPPAVRRLMPQSN